MSYTVVIGLEVHIELNTKSKMFCSCLNDSDEKSPNVNICPVCLGHPGTLPVINQEAVRKVIKTGLALNCQIPEYSKFDRKNYFYPDLPKGYQISQLYFPFCKKGFLKIKGKKIRIKEIHLEEEAGKLLHPENVDYSLVDFNRAGISLMELVTEPNIFSAKEAKDFAEELQLILRYLAVSAANMEKGQMRVEVNISLTKTEKLGTRVEIKNLNSFRAVEKAIEYEIVRQEKILNSREKIVQETRGWDDGRGATISQREKEGSQDYRYFPEPDLPPLWHSKQFIEEIKAELGELPDHRRKRLEKEYGLSGKEIEIFTFNKSLGEYYEKVMSEFRNWVKEADMKTKVGGDEFLRLSKLCSNYMITDLQGLLKGTLVTDKTFLLAPENFAELLTLIHRGNISSKIAKMLLKEMFFTGADPSHIIEKRGLSQITDYAQIEKIVKQIIVKNPKAIVDFKKGKTNVFQFLIGQIMAASKGKTNPQLVDKILREALLLSK